MTSTDLVFNVTQNRPWRSDRRFRVWVAGDALRGALLHQNGAVENTGSFLGGLLPCFDIVGMLLLVVLLPFASIWAAVIGRKERRKSEQLDTLSPSSDEFLAWDELNFRLGARDIQSAEFFEKFGFLPWWVPTHKLKLRLSNGQMWNFSLADRLSADQLQRELSENGILATRRESAV